MELFYPKCTLKFTKQRFLVNNSTLCTCTCQMHICIYVIIIVCRPQGQKWTNKGLEGLDQPRKACKYHTHVCFQPINVLCREKLEDIKRIREELSQRGCELPPLKPDAEHFDSNCITPVSNTSTWKFQSVWERPPYIATCKRVQKAHA